MKKKNSISFYQQDNALLMECMAKAIGGDFSFIDESAFHNQELAQQYNRMVEAFLKSNNNFVMRLNDSMSRIGDSSCVKEMIEQLNTQTTAISNIRSSSQELGDSIQNIVYSVQTIQENSHDAMDASAQSVQNMTQSIEIVDHSSEQIMQINEQVVEFQEKTIKITEIIDMVKKIAQKSGLLALNASIEAARAGEAGKGFAVVASQIKDLSAHTTQSAEDVVRYVGEIRTGIDSLVESIDSTAKQLQSGNESVHQTVSDMKIMNERINTISSAIDTIHNEISNQSALTQTFVASIDSIADSYDVLYEECVGTGQHLYHISRDIDRARSDMARKNSNLSTLDWMTVFEIDHLIFTWRVYNNLADFEKLKITQLNNPKGCKLGKWLYAQTDRRITGSPAYRQVIADHEAIHKHACDSWNAKDSGDRDKALKHFSLAYDAFQKFVVSIHGLREVVKSTGETAETDIKIFNM